MTDFGSWRSSARSTSIAALLPASGAGLETDLVVLADIAFADRAAFLARRAEDLRRVGTQSSNEWERHFRTRSVCHINNRTRRGAQMTVWQILKTAPFSRVSTAERRAWMKMAFYSQLVALGLQVSFIQYDLIVLQKK